MAPFLALRTLKQLDLDEGFAYPKARYILQNCMYVDDCIFGANTIEEAIEQRDQLINLLSRGCFPLSKWAANNNGLLTGISASGIQMNNKIFAEKGAIHILGIQWTPYNDTFHYTISVDPMPSPTKRLIISQIARLFDPLG